MKIFSSFLKFLILTFCLFSTQAFSETNQKIPNIGTNNAPKVQAPAKTFNKDLEKMLNQQKTQVFVCPQNGVEITSSNENTGWDFETTWARFMEVKVADPATMTSGAVVSCIYGTPAYEFNPVALKIKTNLGAGVSASQCSVSGDKISCKNGRNFKCPALRAQTGPSKLIPDWSVTSAYPTSFKSANLFDPPSMGAGAVLECSYNTIYGGSYGVSFTLSTNTGDGFPASSCVVDNVNHRAVCKPQ